MSGAATSQSADLARLGIDEAQRRYGDSPLLDYRFALDLLWERRNSKLMWATVRRALRSRASNFYLFRDCPARAA